MKATKVYKLCEMTEEGKPVSWAACKEAKVYYEIGKYVTANKGQHKELFVFRDLESAREGLPLTSIDELYLAKARKPIELSFEVALLPFGTLCFEKVKLIRRIK